MHQSWHSSFAASPDTFDYAVSGGLEAKHAASAHDGMCSQCTDDIIITAVVVRKWKPPIADMRCEVALALLANHVQVLNERKCTVNVSPEETQNFEVSVEL